MSADPAVGQLSKRLPGRRAFITGAASGLGRALARELAADGWRLGLADLAADRLERVGAEFDAALYIVWPPEYRWLWRVKRFFPLRFLRLVQRMGAKWVPAAERRPRG
jgi:hypothetical protein